MTAEGSALLARASARAIAAGTAAFLVASCAAVNATETAADPVTRDLKRIGYAIGAREDRPLTKDGALLRFSHLLRNADAGPPWAATIAAAEAAAATGVIPCASWSGAAADGVKSRLTLTFKGASAARQAAAAHERIARCFPQLAGPPPWEETPSGLYLLDADGATRTIAARSELPAAFGALAGFLDAARGHSRESPPPPYAMFVEPEGSFEVEHRSGADDAAAAPPDARVRARLCAELGEEPRCADAASAREIHGAPARLDGPRPVVGYRVTVAAPAVHLALSAPRGYIDDIAFDLVETAKLAAGLDRYRDEIAPGAQDSRAKGNETVSDAFGDGCDDPPSVNQTKPYIKTRLETFWSALLHKGNALWKKLETGRDRLDRTKILLVDDYKVDASIESSSSAGPKKLSSFAHALSRDAYNPGESASADEVFITAAMRKDRPDAETRETHALFAANIMGATRRLAVSDGGASNGIIGLALGADVLIATPAEFGGLAKNQRLNGYAVVATVYDPRHEVCVANYVDGAATWQPKPAPTSTDPAHQRIDADGENPTGPVYVISAPQSDVSVQTPSGGGTPSARPCWYLDNATASNIEGRRKDQKSRGVVDVGKSHDVPAFYHMKNGQSASECRGAHCVAYGKRTILVGALNAEGLNGVAREGLTRSDRRDTRLSYDDPIKVLFAPGTAVIAGDRIGAGANPRDGAGARCGTSFAGPVVAAVVAQALANHFNKIVASNVKGWLAATASVPKGLARLFEADMTYGAVNLERAVESDPEKFSIWLNGVSDPVTAAEIAWGSQTLASATQSSPKTLSYIKQPESPGSDQFYVVSLDAGGFITGRGDSYSFDAQAAPCAAAVPEPRRSAGCLRVAGLSVPQGSDLWTAGVRPTASGGADIPIVAITHVVFPIAYWSNR